MKQLYYYVHRYSKIVKLVRYTFCKMFVYNLTCSSLTAIHNDHGNTVEFLQSST